VITRTQNTPTRLDAAPEHPDGEHPGGDLQSLTRQDLDVTGPAPAAGPDEPVRAILQDLARVAPAPRRGLIAHHEPTPGRWAVLSVRLVVLAALLGGWEVAARTGLINPFFYSMPSDIWQTGVTAVTEGTVLADTAYTFSSTILGFLLGTAGGVAIGLSFWWSRRYALVAEPFVIAFEAMPKLALAPIVVLVLGLGIASKVAMATALVIVVQALNAYGGVKSVDRDLTRMLASLGATRRQIFTKVVVPTALPWIISGLRVTIGLALAGAIVGEYIGSTRGIGRMIQYAGTTYEISLIWVGIAILGLLSMVLYTVVGALERRFLTSLHTPR
jgi:NitT/TauT family transport system permease protein